MPAGVFVGSDVVVVMDPAPVIYTTVFHSGSGPDRFIKRKAEEVAILARELAPKRTGALAASISVDQSRNERGQFSFGYEVGTAVRYAAPVHQGAAPHVISKFPGVMSFPGTNEFAGQVIKTEVVNHPGNRATPFLQDALVAMVV